MPLPSLIPTPDPDAPFPAAAVHAGVVHTSGHVPDLDRLSADALTQARQALASLARTLEDAGSSLAHVLRIECYLADRALLPAWNEAYRECFGERCPPRTTLVAGFVLDGLLVEVQATAAVAA